VNYEVSYCTDGLGDDYPEPVEVRQQKAGRKEARKEMKR